MPCRHHPLHAHQRQAGEIVVAANFGRPAVQAHPHPQGTGLAPWLGHQAALTIQRRGQGVAGVGKGGAHGVADDLEHQALVAGDRLQEDCLMPRQGRHHAGRELLVEPGAALDVREEEGHRAGG